MSVSRLTELLGQVVFISCNGKKARGKWGHLTIAEMTPTYLEKLTGNLGVVLGAVSRHLCVLDVDRDDLVQQFLDSNPWLKDTLQTRGNRGRAFWLRMVGDYPDSLMKFLTAEGEPAGEFRGNRSYSIISGRHPETKRSYQILNPVRCLPVAYGSIVWPRGIERPTRSVIGGSQHTANPTEESDVTKETDETNEVAHFWINVSSMEEVLRLATPTNIHQNYDCAFRLARGVRGLEIRSGKRFSPEELRHIHQKWLRRAAKYLRPGQSNLDYLAEFIAAYKAVKYPMGSRELGVALHNAKLNPLHADQLTWIDVHEVRELVAICRELQALQPTKPFFLSCRTVQRIFGHQTHWLASRWLTLLVCQQVLEEVCKGTQRKATRYRLKPLD